MGRETSVVRAIKQGANVPIAGAALQRFPLGNVQRLSAAQQRQVDERLHTDGVHDVSVLLRGRKIIADTYGGMARHGGGAFSGKDPSKVDRTGAYMARYLAKNIVAAELADRCEIELAYAIGLADPVSVMVDTFGTGRVSDEKIASWLMEHIDMRPGSITSRFELRRPIYRRVSCGGHFGENAVGLPWEWTDIAEALQKEILS